MTKDIFTVCTEEPAGGMYPIHPKQARDNDHGTFSVNENILGVLLLELLHADQNFCSFEVSTCIVAHGSSFPAKWFDFELLFGILSQSISEFF